MLESHALPLSYGVSRLDPSVQQPSSVAQVSRGGLGREVSRYPNVLQVHCSQLSLPSHSRPLHRNLMSETSGLSRRRINTGPAPSSSEPSSSSHTSHGGSAFAGGNKIAVDPRDLERDEEESKTGGKVPRLTLMEEVLLLGLKDHQASLF